MHKLSMKHKIRMFVVTVDSYWIYLHKAKSTCWYLDHWPIIWLMYQRKTNSYNMHLHTAKSAALPCIYSVPVLRLYIFFCSFKMDIDSLQQVSNQQQKNNAVLMNRHVRWRDHALHVISISTEEDVIITQSAVSEIDYSSFICFH